MKSWSMEKGWGFIVPECGGADIFLHATALKETSRGRKVGDKVRYAEEADKPYKIALLRFYVTEKRTRFFGCCNGILGVFERIPLDASTSGSRCVQFRGARLSLRVRADQRRDVLFSFSCNRFEACLDLQTPTTTTSGVVAS